MHSPESFEAAAMPLLDSLYRIALCIVHDDAAASHCIEETFARARRAFPLRRERGDFRTWLFAQLFRVIHSRPRRRFGLWFAATAGSEQIQNEILRVAATIPEELREALLLADVEGFHKSEISRILEISEARVSERLAESRGRLRAGLGKEAAWAPALRRSEAV